MNAWRGVRRLARLSLLAVPAIALGQISSSRAAAAMSSASCQVREVKDLPGSHAFGSDFIVAMAGDPDPKARNADIVWALTVDVSSTIPADNRAMYISKTTNAGESWTQVARIDARYFDAAIGEGLRNGLSVSPGGSDFVITTQWGAFQVIPEVAGSDTVVRAIQGPRVPHPQPRLTNPKREDDPIMAGVVRMTADDRHMIVGYGYFDRMPLLITYHKDEHASWIDDGPLAQLPSDLDILSMQFDDSDPNSLYVGTGDQAYRLDLRTMQWTLIAGVGPDSAIHSISTVGGPHLAACWGVYNPLSADAVQRVTEARFLLHRAKDEVGPNLRAYSIEVDSARPNRELVTSITGAYVSEDSGQTWRRLNDLPDGEYRSAHFNSDGSVIVSGLPGTFLVNPFSSSCSPLLKTREKSVQ